MPAANHFLMTSLALLLVSADCVQAEPMQFELRDGRRIVGDLVGVDGGDWLWIRASTAGIELQSRFHRADIRQMQPAPVAALPSLLPDVAAQSPPEAIASPPLTRVKTLLIEAKVAQWDDDAQADGIRIFVLPLSADGSLVPISGELEVHLLGERETLVGGRKVPIAPQFVELQRGNRLLRPEDFASGAAVFELAFDQVRPDFDPNLACNAIVYARLGVFGQGVFEASDAQIGLREPSRIRDQLQQHTGRRFFPIEQALPANR